MKPRKVSIKRVVLKPKPQIKKKKIIVPRKKLA